MEFEQLRALGKTDGEIAARLGVSRARVWYWRNKGISQASQAEIQVRTRGRIRAALATVKRGG
jgi:transcriptional regulator